jgi:hypothetical protein
MDTYQPIYDAVRSVIRGGNIAEAVEMAISNAGLDHYARQALYAVQRATEEYERPCVVFRARLYLDGNSWCAVVGDDLVTGCAAFGESPDIAMRNFDKAWFEKSPDAGKGE